MDRTALNGIRIIDFTRVLAGPYATRILADFGAEVIKVQSSKTATGAESNNTGYFDTWNRNKLGITLDMTYPEAKNIVLKLVKKSDVIIENFTPRVMSNWELTYEVFKKVKPDIIMASMSGMGQTGPWKDFAALGHTIQALSGITYLTSYNQEIPTGIGYAYSDIVAGLFAAMAVMAALELRTRTGEGQYIDISEYETMCSMLGPAILDCSVNHNIVTPQGNNHDYIPAAPYGCYKCQGFDRWCIIAVFSEEEWISLCRIMGNPPWVEQEKFSTLAKRKGNFAELNELLQQWTSGYTAEKVMSLLQEADVPTSIINDARDLINNPQLKARNFFIQAHHPLLGDIHFDGTPIKLSDTPATFRQTAPSLGQDNRYVYQKILGLNEKQLSRYIEKGIIG